jgi:predicted phage terminase large subunit-like protein
MDQATLRKIQTLPVEQQVAIAKKAKQVTESKIIDTARGTFMGYVKHMWPAFIEGRHHRIMGNAFDRVLDGSLKRLIINMGPRHTKSEFASHFLPSKFLGHFPDRKVIQTSHTALLAEGFGRKVRDLVDTGEYKRLYPSTSLKTDSKAAGRWNTSSGGEYFAIGVGGKLAGKGADLLIIDDPHSEQEYIRALGGDPSSFDDTFEWYQTGPRQRLQPGAAIVIVMTRWHMRDLTGRLVRRMTEKSGLDQWEVIEFPAIMPSGNALWPEFWSQAELEATREELTAQQWNAQYLQHPTSEEGALIKREWWNVWERRSPPECEYVIQCWDTAFTAKETSDYSACTTWGVFYWLDEDTGNKIPNIILLDAYRERLEFPSLKKKALELYKKRQPDAFIIESKASGLPLIFELRQMGIYVQEFQVSRGTRAAPNDKIARVNSISDIFASGVVWRPDTRWAEDVMEELAAFPGGDHDDYVDSTIPALLRFRHGGFIPLDSDQEDEPYYGQQTADYY